MEKSNMQKELIDYVSEKNLPEVSKGFQAILEIFFDTENWPDDGAHLEKPILTAVDFMHQFNRIVRA